MKPALKNLEIPPGAFYRLRVTFKKAGDPPRTLNYGAMTFTAALRDRTGDVVFVPFDVDATRTQFGELTLTLDEDVTADLAGVDVWDLWMTDGSGHPRPILSGYVFAGIVRTAGRL